MGHVFVFCGSDHHRRIVPITDFRRDEAGQWAEHRVLGPIRDTDHRPGIEVPVPGVTRQSSRQDIGPQDRPAVFARKGQDGVIRIAGPMPARQRFSIRCPRCPANVVLTQQLLTEVMDGFAAAGIDRLPLHTLAAMVAKSPKGSERQTP